ncbi:Putative reactive intermediate deaminase TdcF [Phycisphaerae bacterium RAS2]|nr:Putative reactive intermediate deaminase TdcF [Phycisphaerae bacterium RAS2]
MATNRSTRRRFLSNTGKLAIVTSAAAAGASNIAAEAVHADEPQSSNEKANRPDRRVVPGSPSKAYSRAMQSGRFVFVAGCVGTYQKDGKSAMDADFESQARRTLENLKASVEAAGSSLDKVLKCTCFLKKYEDFAKFNEVYMTIFPEPRPARSTVVVLDFVVPGALLEVDCVCVV